MNKLAIGIFGGTFDPFHNGHLQLLRSVLNSRMTDRIFLMPNYIPPHKPQPVANDQQRLAMINLVCKHENQIYPLDYEIKKKSVSYTYETISELQNNPQFLNCSFSLLIGMDSLINFLSWFKAEELLNSVNLIVARRPHYTPDRMDRKLLARMTDVSDFNKQATGQIVMIDNQEIDISSSEIRSRRYNDLKKIVPDYINEYINKQNIYNKEVAKQK
jgi:nicotinate-nucleotide adenylyltransferase